MALNEIKPVTNPVFPTYNGLAEVINEAVFALEDGELEPNQLRVLFGSYHNTLIKLLEHQQQR